MGKRILFTVLFWATLHVNIRENVVTYIAVDNTIALLEKLAQGECSICDTAEVFHIIAVALNRVKSNLFPNDLCSVLHDPNQFHGFFRVHDESPNNIVRYCARYYCVVEINDIHYFARKTVPRKNVNKNLKLKIEHKFHNFYGSQ